MNKEDLARFLRYVKQYEDIDECWMWIGYISGWGYGYFKYRYKMWQSHRWIYTYFFGSIPEARIIHHRCHNKLCVNPYHLECLTWLEHRQAHAGEEYNSTKTHCRKGHEFSRDNTYVYKNKYGIVRRFCKACRSIYHKERKNG